MLNKKFYPQELLKNYTNLKAFGINVTYGSLIDMGKTTKGKDKEVA